MQTRRLALVLVAFGLVVVSACSGGDIAEEIIESQEGVGDVEIDEESGEVSVETDDGSATIGGGEVPDDFPIAVPDGGEVQAVMDQGDAVSVALTYPGGFDDIVSFYESWIDSSGSEVANRVDSSSPQSVGWTLTDEDGGSTINVVDLGDGNVQVLLITN